MRKGRKRADYQGVSCPYCKKPLEHSGIVTGVQDCRWCSRNFEAIVFNPVEYHAKPLAVGLSPDQTVPCARHARNTAVASCERCGVFMCSLCRIDADGKIFCPTCFDRLSTEGSLVSTTTKIRNYAYMASLCLIVGLFISFIAAPAGILGVYYCIKGLSDKRKREESHGIVGLYIRMVLCVLWAIGGVLLLLLIFGFFRKNGE